MGAIYRLIIEDDEGHQSVVPVPRSEITIGRRDGNTIKLNERSVSRLHARMLEESGALFLEDAGSRYGLKVNGQRVRSRILLRPGDDITIGEYHLAVMKDDGPLLCQNSAAALPNEMQPARSHPDEPADEHFARTLPHHPEDRDGCPRLALRGGSPESPPQEVMIWGMRTTIGRTTENDISIVHPSVKRRHALLLADGDQIRLQGLEGVDAIRVNGQFVRRSVLHDGDQIELGQIALTFVQPAAKAIPLTATPPLGIPRPLQLDDLEAGTVVRIRPEGRSGRLAGVPAGVPALLAVLALLACGLLLFFLFADRHQVREPASPPLASTSAVVPDPASTEASPSVGTGGSTSAIVGSAVPAPSSPVSDGVPLPVAEQLKLARESMALRQWDHTLSTLKKLLDSGASSPEIEQLFITAQQEKGAAAQLVKARQLAAEQSIEAAFLIARTIAPTSVYSSEADDLARNLAGKVVKLHLDRGHQLEKAGKPTAALEEYQAALALDAKNAKAQKAVATLLQVVAEPRTGAPGVSQPAISPKPVAPSSVAVQPTPPLKPSPPGTAVAGQTPATPSAPRTGPATSPAANPPSQPLPPREEAKLLFEKGRQLQLKGRFQEAEQKMHQAAELSPSYADPHLALAFIYSRLNQKDRALVEMRTFLKLAPNDPRRPKVESMMRALASSPP